MALENILSQEIVQRLGWTLLHFVWQAATIALLAAILLAVLRKCTASARHIVACTALGLIVLLPIVTMQLIPVSTPRPIVGIEPMPESVMALVPPTKETPLTKIVEYEEPALPESVSHASAASWKQRAVERFEPALPYLVAGWLLGVFGLSLWHLGGWAQLQRLRKKMVKQVNVSLRATLNQLADRLGVGRAVELMESALVQVPTVVGWLRPVILLPASALTGLTTEQLEALLAHELAHIRRYDYLVNMLQTVVETLGFYHPAVWWVSHKIRVERENCCDDLAVSISGDRIRYARALTSMEEIRAGRSDLAVAATGGNLFSRIRRLLGKDSADTSRASWIPSVITILLIAIIAIPTTLALTANDKTPQSAQFLLDKMLEHRSRVKNLQYVAEDNIWRDLAAEQDRIEDQIKSMRERGIPERQLERFRQSRTEAPESSYQILRCTVDDEERIKIEQTGGTYDSSGNKVLRDDKHIWAWNGILATELHQISGLPASAIIRDMPHVATRLGHPWRSFTGIFCGFLEETIAAEIPVSVEKLEDNTYRIAFVYKTRRIAAIINPSQGYTCPLQEYYNEQGQLTSRNTIKYEEVTRDIWFPVSGQIEDYSPNGTVRYRSIAKLSQIRINDPSFNVGYFDVDMPEGTEVADEVHGKQYVVGSKRVYDLDEPQKPSTQTEEVDPNSWQEKFYSIYRLEDGQVLKRIAPPYIPERRGYFKSVQPGRYSSNTYDQLVSQYFYWDGNLSIKGARVGSGIPRLNSILESVIGLGNRQYDIPTEILSADMSGDWIVRKDTPQEELLQALEQIVKDETSRDIDFVKQKVETDVIIAKGKYNFQLLPNITDGQYVLISANRTDTYTGGGGGSGTLGKFLHWVGNRVEMNIVDETEAEDVELSWRNHDSSDLSRLNHDAEPYNQRLDLLLKNLTWQMGLTFKKETATVEKWFISEKGTIKVPQKADAASVPGGAMLTPTTKDEESKTQQEQLNNILKKFSDGTSGDNSGNNSKSVRESVENYIAAALAGEDEKAAEYAYPDTAVAAQTNDMRKLLQGQDIKIVAACIGEWNSLAISSVIQVDGMTGSIVFHLKKVILDQKVHWLIDDIDLETLDTIGKQISYFLKNVPDAKTIIIPAYKFATEQVGGQLESNTKSIQPDQVVLKLVDPNAQPVAGARVGTYVDWSDIAENPPIWFLRYGRNSTSVSVKSDEHGKVTLEADEIFGSGWTIEGLAPLTAIDEGHYLTGLREMSRQDLGKEVTMLLQPGCRVHGRLTAAASRKHNWSTKILTVYVHWYAHRPCQYTSKQGRFEFVLPPGKYEVMVYAEDPDKAIILPILIKPGQRELDMTKYLDGTSKLPAVEIENLTESDSPGESRQGQTPAPGVPMLAKSAAPSGVDKSIVKVECLVGEVYPDPKMDTETIIAIKNLLDGKITLPDSPAVADLLRKATEATAAVKDEPAGDKRVTQEQFDTLVDLLVSRGFVKILMNPTLEVVELQTAQIKTDQNSLEVTANAVKDDIIYLTVKADLSSQTVPEGEGQKPIISRRSFASFFSISSGQSQIIGGMIQPAARPDADGTAKVAQTPAGELMCIVTASIVAPAGNATQPMETVNFQNAEVRTVIEKLAQWAGKTIIPPADLLKQKITIYSPEQMPRSEAAALILNSLRSKGYTAEQTDDTIYLKSTEKEQPDIGKARIVHFPEDRVVTRANDISDLAGTSEDVNDLIRRIKETLELEFWYQAGGVTDSNFGRFGDANQIGKIGDYGIGTSEKAYFATRNNSGEILSEFGFEVLLYKEGDLWELKKPYRKIYRPDFTCYITADKGSFEFETGADTKITKDATFNGNVLIHIIPGNSSDIKETKIYLDELVFLSDRSQLVMGGPVTVISGDLRMGNNGYGSPPPEILKLQSTNPEQHGTETKEPTADKPMTRVYDISDLVGATISRGTVDGMMDGSGGMGGQVNIPDQAIVIEAQNIVNLIIQTIDPNSWYENDPNAIGIITPYPVARPRKLAIYQILTAHQQIEKFLESRREQINTTQISIELRYLYTNVEFLDEVRDSMDIEFKSDTFLDDKQVETLLRASQKSRDIRSLTAPSVRVLNNETARFSTARHIFMSFLGYSEPNNLSQQSSPVPINTFCKITPHIEDNKNIIIDFVQDIPGLQERIIYDRREMVQSYTETTAITNKRIPKNKTFAFTCDIKKIDQDNQTASPAEKKTLIVLIKPTIIVQEEMPRSKAATMTYNSLRSKGYTAEQSDETILLKPAKEEQPGTGKDQILIDIKILTVSDDFLKYIGLDPNSVASSEDWSDYLIHSTDDSASFVIDQLHTDLILKAVAVRMQTHKDIQMLHKPQVLAKSGKKFEIHITDSEHYMLIAPAEPNGSSVESESKSNRINRIELGTIVRLMPTLTPDGKNVELDFEWEYRRLRGVKEHTGPDGIVQKVPQIDVDSIKTPCTVPDAKTLLIAGKKITEQKKKEPRKPRLADLPLIGLLFNSPPQVEETRNILILVKPDINPDIKAPPPRQSLESLVDPNDPLIKQLEEKFNRSDEQK